MLSYRAQEAVKSFKAVKGYVIKQRQRAVRLAWDV